MVALEGGALCHEICMYMIVYVYVIDIIDYKIDFCILYNDDNCVMI